MSNNVLTSSSPWSIFAGPNLGYVMEQYDLYQTSPEQVDPELVALFQQFGSPIVEEGYTATEGVVANVQPGNMSKIFAAVQLADAIRSFGHLAADIYPLKDRKLDTTKIEASYYGLTDADLVAIPASLFFTVPPANVSNGKQAVDFLRSIYTDKIGFEFSHVEDKNEREWIQAKIESGSLKQSLNTEEKKAILERLTRVENFEKFIHKTFVGQKRFSIEGLDTLVVLLDEIVKMAEKQKMNQVQMGMAHRGRLNVLTHVVNKPYDMMFADFAHVPNDYFFPEDGSLEITKGWTGDVKYHMGAAYTHKSGLKVKLAYNPSHLEVVSPVVTGATRAAQEDTTSKPGYPTYDPKKALSVLVHGDAAFAGEGIVQETFNYANTKGFSTGGSIHIISNNMIGFTTEHYDSRSTRYSSDLAKGYGIPVIHVNADDPEAVAQVARFAFEYREIFGKDVLIDLIGYRRFGHNETDDPTVTNPLTYLIVSKHPTVRALYGEKLTSEGVVTSDEVKKLDADVYAQMQASYDHVKQVGEEKGHFEISMPEEVKTGYPAVDTSVPKEDLLQINNELLAWPETFEPQNKLAKILNKRIEAVETGKIDWGHAETLAFAATLRDGNPVRITGQDAERGTFSQRHLVLHDKTTGAEFVPLHNVSGSKATFAVHNSPLTETAIIGFEYGYNLEHNKALTIWEGQFGDFANMAQVMFDNFISSSRSKWGQKSGLVILLPTGMEGQGPEHSSARIERYLQSSAENNWIVANCSNAGNYFHLLRRQAKMLGTEAVRPLVVGTPKSLLRHPLAAATIEDLSEGSFQEVIEQPGLGKNVKKVERILIGSGRVTIDLAEHVNDGEGFDDTHILRVEQLYPFPSEKLSEIISRYPNVKEIRWVQEEPKNQGPWKYALEYLLEIADGKKLKYVGRPEMASTSEGDADSHKVAQAKVIQDAFAK